MLSPEIWSILGGLTLNYFGFSKKCSSQNNNFMIFQDKCSKIYWHMGYNFKQISEVGQRNEFISHVQIL